MQFGKGILPAKEYLSNGLFSIQNCYSEAESSFNQQLHFHDFYELSLIYEGSSRFLINGSSFVAAAGSLQLIRPSDYHRQMTDTGEYIRYYNLIFRQEVLSERIVGCAGRSGRTVLLSDAGKGNAEDDTAFAGIKKRAGRKRSVLGKNVCGSDRKNLYFDSAKKPEETAGKGGRNP